MQSLPAMGNPLECITKLIDFEMFRPTLESVLFTEERRSNARRPPIDPVLMFKLMFVQRLYGLSDEQTENEIKDCTSFRDFLGLFTVENVPDVRTTWKNREDLTGKVAYDRLFKDFGRHLDSLRLIVNEGKIIDASFVVAPAKATLPMKAERSRRAKAMNCGTTSPIKRVTRTRTPAGLRNETRHFTATRTMPKYAKNKWIRGYDTTSASIHDFRRSANLIDYNAMEGENVWADAGYVGTEEEFAKKKVNPVICEKGRRNHPLTDGQKKSNREKSKTRSRVEHVFGFIERSMGALMVRSIGMVRAKAAVAMTNLTYNIARLSQIFKYHPDWIAMPL